MTGRFVAVMMGSDSDLPVMQTTFEVFDRLGVAYEARITSAHRTPDATRAYVHDAAGRGCAVFVAAAGLAAHLAGAVAAETIRPVIGVPIDAGPLKGLDALLSTVQMPAGIWTVDRSASSPFSGPASMGTPMTGRMVSAATAPARWAASPAAATNTAQPRPAASWT